MEFFNSSYISPPSPPSFPLPPSPPSFPPSAPLPSFLPSLCPPPLLPSLCPPPLLPSLPLPPSPPSFPPSAPLLSYRLTKALDGIGDFPPLQSSAPVPVKLEKHLLPGRDRLQEILELIEVQRAVPIILRTRGLRQIYCLLLYKTTQSSYTHRALYYHYCYNLTIMFY